MTLQITFNGVYYFIKGDDIEIRCDEKSMLAIVETFLPIYEKQKD